MNWEMLTAIGSSVIALCALVYSIRQGKQLQKHNRLSFKPHIDNWVHSEHQKGFYTVDLLNNGLGPAVIKEFTLSVDGVPITGNGTEPIEKALKILFPDTNYESHHSTLAKNYVLGAKEKCRVIAIKFTQQPFPSKESFENTEVASVFKPFGSQFKLCRIGSGSFGFLPPPGEEGKITPPT